MTSRLSRLGSPGPRRRAKVCRWSALAAAAGTLGLASPAGTALVAAQAPAVTSSPCSADIRYGTLPIWAQAGFNPADQPMPYVLGARGGIVAILWARHDPLLSPPSPDRRNKILWVSRLSLQPLSNLQITARHVVGTTPVGPVERRVVLGGPGPSGIDMPSAGCWQFSLRWSGHMDQVDLEYSPDR
jgi:hypothetical protein